MSSQLNWGQKRKLLKFFVPSIKNHPEWPVIISEGDSWFSFPLFSNTIDILDSSVGRKISLLRLEKSGDEILKIFGGKQKIKLRRYLERYPVEALLFSGGGNDVVGSDLLSLLEKNTPGRDWEDCIHKTRVRNRIRQIRYAYEDLINIRNDVRPDCVIYANGYDYAIPNGKAVKIGPIKAGPWLQPYFLERGITKLSDQKKIIRWIIDEFNSMLSDLETKTDGFVHVRTTGTLKASEWNDELHPKRAGFVKVAEKFRKALRKQFPGTF